LIAQDASELYAHNQYNLLALMLKDNIIKIDWTDEVLAKTALTHDGKMSVVPEKAPEKPAVKSGPASKHPATEPPTKAA
jgi:NAD(P) transhydrogenase subunit alpha